MKKVNKNIIRFFHILVFTMSVIFYKAAAQTKPNIVIINVDDMGWKDVGFVGSKYYETPNIDALAASGMIFTNGYAASANCAPSRACLMTGKWTPRHGIYTVGSSERGNSKHRKLIPVKNTTTLDKQHITIPELLKVNGYKTCHSGKWHLSKNPLEYGFDVNIGGGHHGHPSSYYPPYKNIDINQGKNDYLTDLIMEKTIGLVDTISSPFFIYYAPYAVHTPINPVKDLLEKYKHKEGGQRQNNAEYATMVENLDRNIGLLISKLREREIFKNTLIVFTSDNGGLFGITNQHPLRAGKGSYYEGGIREPFFFVMKGKITENSISNIPITNLDIFPTIMDYAGVKIDFLKVDGNNIKPVLEKEINALDRPLYWHFPIYLQAYNKDVMEATENRDPLFRTRPGSVIRYKDWKLHYYFENNEIELYNLVEDIGERNDLSKKNPEKAKELLNNLKTWWSETGAPIPKKLNPDYEGGKS